MTENKTATEKKTDATAAGDLVVPRMKDGLPPGMVLDRRELARKGDERKTKHILFVTAPHHTDCGDNVCLQRQARLATTMKEIVEVFAPETVDRIGSEDFDARAEKGVPDIWTYDAGNDENPVGPLDDLAVIDFEDGARRVLALIDVPPFFAPPSAMPPRNMYG